VVCCAARAKTWQALDLPPRAAVLEACFTVFGKVAQAGGVLGVMIQAF